VDKIKAMEKEKMGILNQLPKIIKFPGFQKKEQREEKTPLGGKLTWIRSFDGAKIYYAYYIPKDKSKRKEKRTIVFGSGWLAFPMIWRRQVEAFKNDYYIITIRNRGCFGSELGKSTAKTYIEDSAEDLKQILDERKVKKAVIVGHSMWGLIALQFYKKYPQRVAGLVLVSAPDANPLDYFFFKRLSKYQFLLTWILKIIEKVPVIDILKNLLISRTRNFNYLIQVALTGTLINQGYLDEEELNQIILKIKEVPSKVGAMSLRAMLDMDLSDILPHISVPTLVVAGKADPIVMWTSSKRIVEDINFDREEKYAELFLMPKCGHIAMMEHPSKFNQKFQEFLEKRVIPYWDKKRTREYAEGKKEEIK
jgi:pimeloyl-ACP methyl ester carboxylesterase